ncbi:MAG: GAF domain-containing protein, partial [Anaerolineae bacterium]
RDDLAFLTALADQTTIALDNAQLYERTEKRARELATLIEVGQTIASTLDLQTVLSTIMTKAVQILDVEAGSLLLMDEKGEELVFQVALGPISDVFDSIRVPLGTGIAGTVAQEGTPLIVNDAQLDPRWWVGVDRMTRFSTRGILCAPLISKEQVIGVIEVINKRDSSPFNEEELNLLSSFAAQAAIAIENARLYTMTDQALAKRVEELSIMQEIDRQLNATLDFDQVMDLTLEWALRTTGSKTGALAIVNQERNGMLLLANRGYPPEYDRYRQQPWPLDQGTVGRVVRTGQPALVSDVSQDPDYVKAIAETRSQLTVPILREDQVSGVINLESPELAGFNEDDLAFVMRLADHAAIAIENAKLYADVKRANEAKSDFVSFVSHELKISMTSIKGYAKLLDMGTAGEVSEAQRDFLRVITSNVDRMDALVRDLLDLSRIETGRLRLKKEPVAIRTLVQEVLQAIQGEIEARELNLTLDVPEDLPLVWGDQARLTQVITNLMSNAYKYTPAGGSIAIKCQVSSGAVQEPSDRDFVTISVSDTGIGISAEDQARVFTEFFRADDPLVQEAGGTGLGLSITKRLVEMHGGRIWFESEPGQGSTFHIALPLVTDDAQAKPPKF